MDRHWILSAPGLKNVNSYYNMGNIGIFVKLVSKTGMETDIDGLQNWIDNCEPGDYWRIGEHAVIIRVNCQADFGRGAS